MTDCPCRAPLLTFMLLTFIICLLLAVIAELVLAHPTPVIVPHAL